MSAPTCTTEQDVLNAIRLEASRNGMLLWRNNVGALRDVAGRLVRYGLANDSAALNKRLKSSDLIGIFNGRMVCVECKSPGWRYTGAGREPAQLAWIELIRAQGGIACFASCWADVLLAVGTPT